MSASATGTAAGAAIVVTTTADELIDDGNCSLREAIQAVNTQIAVDGCGDGGFETIELPSGVYTLTLAGPNEDDNATGDLDIKGSVTVQGTGASVPVVDGNQLDRVLQVHSSATVAVIGVTIRNGRAPDGASGGDSGGDGGDGGGIANAGTLTLSGCDIGGNRAGNGAWAHGEFGGGIGGDAGRGGGVFNTGTLALESGSVRDNVSGEGGSAVRSAAGDAGHGGGIYNAGSLVVKGSTIRGNSTAIGGMGVWLPGSLAGSGGYGGGIYNAGSLTLDGSTIHGNRTANGDMSGGIHGVPGDGGHGGGIYNANTLGLSNSTVSGNFTGNGGEPLMERAGNGGDGGGIYNAGTLSVDNGTVSANITGAGGESPLYPGDAGDGGGIYSAGTLITDNIQVRNTILAGNVSTHAAPDCSGALTSVGYNLVQVVSGCTIAGDTTGNIVGLDPWLLPLADNGGPTWTQALAPGSVAVDAGSCTGIGGAAITVDQRGIRRPQSVTCDVGAYEAPVFLKVYLPFVLRSSIS
jgi:CSLREA domain-containing protein